MCSFSSIEVDDVVDNKGIYFPRDIHVSDVIVTGPPGSGKTTLVQSLGGWPMEGYLDLASNWWRSSMLAYHPREVHLGFPCRGQKHSHGKSHKYSHSVFDPHWMASPSQVELDRIRIPPEKRSRFFNRDWRSRYVFDFQLPSAEELYAVRSKRARLESHPVDVHLSEELVQKQLEVYEILAQHLHHCGMRVYIRREFSGHPMRIRNTQDTYPVRRRSPISVSRSEASQLWEMFK